MLLFTQASVPGTYFLWVLKNCWPCLSVLRSLWTSSQSLKFPFPMVCPFLTKLDQTGLERSASWLLIWERITELQEIWEVRILYPKERKKREKEENIWKRNVYFFLQRRRKTEKEQEENIWNTKISLRRRRKKCGLVWKSVSPLNVITLRQSKTIFPCIRPFFGMVKTNQTNELPNSRVILLQAGSWLVRRQSFAGIHLITLT